MRLQSDDFLIANQLQKIFASDLLVKPQLVLNHVSFSIKHQRITALLGHNGAGKSTFFHLLLGFIQATSGQIVVNPLYGGQLSPEKMRSQWGYLPETMTFYRQVTGRELLLLMGRLGQSEKSNSLNLQQRIEELGNLFELNHALDKKIAHYSRGMQQRLGLMNALLLRPKFVILDEPTSGLDPLGRKRLKEILKQLHREGMTILMSTHIMSDVEDLCQDLILLQQGKVLYQGTLEQLHQSHQGKNIEDVLYHERHFIDG